MPPQLQSAPRSISPHTSCVQKTSKPTHATSEIQARAHAARLDCWSPLTNTSLQATGHQIHFPSHVQWVGSPLLPRLHAKTNKATENHTEFNGWGIHCSPAQDQMATCKATLTTMQSSKGRFRATSNVQIVFTELERRSPSDPWPCSLQWLAKA